MSNLSKFLKKNKKQRENTTFAATKSIADENGKALEWVLRPLTTKMNEDIRDECTVEIPVDKKRHMYRQKLNTSKYGTKLIVASVIEPDLNNAELQDSYGVKTPDELVQEMIDDPGEFAEFQKFIQEYNGFAEKDSEAVDEAKN